MLSNKTVKLKNLNRNKFFCFQKNINQIRNKKLEEIGDSVVPSPSKIPPLSATFFIFDQRLFILHSADIYPTTTNIFKNIVNFLKITFIMK